MGIHTYTTVTKPKLMARATLTTSSATYYTAPTGPTTAVITNIVLTSSAGSSSESATVTLNSVILLSDVPVPKGAIVTFVLEQVLPSGHTLAAFASSAGVIQMHVTGVEVV
jgi:hypothetical protein